MDFYADGLKTYYVAVDGKDGAEGHVSIRRRPPPPNDFLGAADPIASDSDEAGYNYLAGKEGGEPSHAGNAGGHSVWYAWQAPSSGPVQLDTCGSDFDTLLAVYTGAEVGSLNPVAANDDGAACGPQSELSFAAAAGTTYRIAVDGKDGAVGTFQLRLAPVHPPGSPPANDDFSSPEPLSGREARSSPSDANTNATKQVGEPDHAGNPGGGSIWYRWTAPADGTAKIDTCNSGFDTLLAVYDGEGVGALTPVAANDDSAVCGPGSEVLGTGSRITMAVRAGTTYRIAVDGYDGARGAVALLLRYSVDPTPSAAPPPEPTAEITPPAPRGCSQGKVRRGGRCVRRPHKCRKGKVRRKKRCVNRPRHKHRRGGRGHTR